MSNLIITKPWARKLQVILADLEVQAMIFDMAIDYETLTLTPKETYIEPFWLTRWKDKQDGSDQDNRFDYDQE